MQEPWESCITICNQWSWKPNDTMKSLQTCIQTLVKTAAGNGNLLFNVGPMLDGRMEARQVQRLKEMGSWLQQYGSSIYSTKGGPYKPNDIYATTRKGNRIYVHIFNNKQAVLELAALPKNAVKKAYLMKGSAVNFQQDANGALKLHLPEALPDVNDSVVVLELDQDAEAIPVIEQ
jgi:alpha-L-fucosidase